MDEDAIAQKTRLFEQYRDIIVARELSNTEHFDKAILTYSAAGLALSLSFLKDIKPAHQILHAYLLHGSWIFFVAAIVLTIISYPVSQKGLRDQLSLAERYYLNDDQSAFSAKNRCAKAIEYIGVAAGIFFIAAVIFSTAFVSINIGESNMADFKNKGITTSGIGMDGAPIPTMQEFRNSAGVPSMTRAAGVPQMQAMPKVANPPAPVSEPAATTPAAPPVVTTPK